MNRRDFQKLSRIRLKEAKALLDAGLWDGAYYLAGYAVECALKACIAKGTQRYEFPERRMESAQKLIAAASDPRHGVLSFCIALLPDATEVWRVSAISAALPPQHFHQEEYCSLLGGHPAKDRL